MLQSDSMDYLQIVAGTLIAYLIGSIPTAVWVSKWIYGIDIREHGSGNASHTNVHHILGRRTGLKVQLLDVLKGVLAAKLAFFVHRHYGFFSDIEYPLLMMTFGLAGVMGHIFPFFAGLRGGKGYHVSLGVLIAIHPLATAVFTAFSLGIYFLFRYPQLAYVAGAIALAVFVALRGRVVFGDLGLPMLLFSLSLSMMLLLTHREELQRVWAGGMLRVRPGRRRRVQR